MIFVFLMLIAWLSSSSPSVLTGPIASGILDVKILGPHPRSFESGVLGGGQWNPSICVLTGHPGDSDAHKSENSTGGIKLNLKPM